MRKRPLGAASVVAALMLWMQPAMTGSHEARDYVRLDRATASAGPLPRSTSRVSGSDEGGHAIPLSGDAKHLVVEGTLNGTVRGPMLVDTGASYCVLTHGTARRLGLSAKPRERIPVATANGQINAAFVELEALALHEAELTGVRAVVMDAVEPPLIGIVGLNYLTRFRFSVDLAEGTLRLEP